MILINSYYVDKSQTTYPTIGRRGSEDVHINPKGETDGTGYKFDRIRA